MESRQVHPWLGRKHRQNDNKNQWPNDNMRGPIIVGRFEFVAVFPEGVSDCRLDGSARLVM